MPDKHLTIRNENGITIVALNRPEAANRLNRQMIAALVQTITRCRGDEAVHGVLLTGASGHFCDGTAVDEMTDLSPLEAGALASEGQRLMFAIESLGKPVVAAVNGAALGGGLELALACDFILAAASATFGFPDVTLGIIPGFGGTQRLPRLIGKSRAKELIMSGELIDAAEALRIGLVNRVHQDDQLFPEACAVLRKICSRGLLSLRMAKEVIDAGVDMDLRNACLMERDAFALCFTTVDQKEGMGAFLEKRQPRFQGR